MISAFTGTLRHVHTDRIEIECGPMMCELLVPASDLESLQEKVGQTITFHTLLYLEGDPNRGNLEPRLLGFSSQRDKGFFEEFTTVNGIGPRKALKALTAPIADIAHAIEAGNTKFLISLPQIGKRLAEQIVATLAGKLAKYTAGPVERVGKPAARANREEEAAIALLSGPQMGLKRAEAEALLARVREEFPDLKSADELIPEMLKLHSSR